MKMLKIPVLALLGALSLAACGDGNGTGIGDLREGRFEGEIEGVLDGRISGDAYSGSSEFGFHDLIVLTDFVNGVEVVIYNVEDEFIEGRAPIGDAAFFDEEVVAWVYLLDDDEEFESISGTIDIDEVTSNHIDGTARFTAESTFSSGDVIQVDVAFRTFFDSDLGGGLNASRSPATTIRADVKRR